MAKAKKIKAAILGFGGMGHCHGAQYAEQKEVELVAVCDIDKSKFHMDNVEINFGNSGKTDTKGLKCYLCYEELIANEPDLDYIDICLPTDLHCEYAIRAMKDGFNVLCEKPMALNSKDANRMIQTSKKTGKFLMIAQCLRFDSSFAEITKAYKSGKYGKLLRYSLKRMGGFPGGWFRDVKRSGGALMDLHIHDCDFVQSLLGKPDAIRAMGVVVKSGGIDDLSVDFLYENGPLVHAESSWAYPGWYCSMYAVFEEATILVANGKVQLYQMDKKVKDIKLKDKHNCYFNEIAYFAHCVKTGTKPEVASMESTRDTILILEKEVVSANGKGKLINL